jgi:hypothetical protein
MQFVRMASAAPMFAPAIVALMSNFDWKRCVLFSYAGEAYSIISDAWSAGLTSARIDVQLIKFTFTQYSQSGELQHPISDIRATRRRVILVLARAGQMQTIAVTAFDLGMIDRGWAWISDGRLARTDMQVSHAPLTRCADP